MLTALVFMSLVQTLPRLDTTKDFWMHWVGTEIFWPWYTLIGATVTLAVAWALDKLSPKIKMNVAGS
jgi:hypothetical protein